MNKTCICLGGGTISVDFELRAKMHDAILRSIEEGYTKFLCGGFGNWSFLYASVLREYQKHGKDIHIACYIAESVNAERYRAELLKLEVYDHVYILPGKNIVETDLFLIRKCHRILVPKQYGIKNHLLLRAIHQLHKEVLLI